MGVEVVWCCWLRLLGESAQRGQRLPRAGSSPSSDHPSSQPAPAPAPTPAPICQRRHACETKPVSSTRAPAPDLSLPRPTQTHRIAPHRPAPHHADRHADRLVVRALQTNKAKADVLRRGRSCLVQRLMTEQQR